MHATEKNPRNQILMQIEIAFIKFHLGEKGI